MLPVILVSRDNEVVEDYLQKLMHLHSIPTSSVYLVRPEKKLLIESIREVTTGVMRHTSGSYLVVIYKFHTASAVIQNTLLKTLEEESEHVYFVLVVEDESTVLPTVRSRSHTLYLDSQNHPSVSFKNKYPSSSLSEWMSNSAKVQRAHGPDLVDAILRDLHQALLQEDMPFHLSKPIHDVLLLRSHMLTYNINHEHIIDGIGHILVEHNIWIS